MDVHDSDSQRLAQRTRWPRSDVVVVELDGDLDLATAPEVTSYLRGLTADGVRHLVLDMTAVAFMSSHGVSMIVRALAETATLDRVHLVGVAQNRAVRRVLDITQVRGRFSDHHDVAELLRTIDAGG